MLHHINLKQLLELGIIHLQIRMLNYMFEQHYKNKRIYFHNDIPIGTRAEIIDVRALKRIHKQLYDPNQSEYMTTC